MTDELTDQYSTVQCRSVDDKQTILCLATINNISNGHFRVIADIEKTLMKVKMLPNTNKVSYYIVYQPTYITLLF